METAIEDFMPPPDAGAVPPAGPGEALPGPCRRMHNLCIGRCCALHARSAIQWKRNRGQAPTSRKRTAPRGARSPFRPAANGAAFALPGRMTLARSLAMDDIPGGPAGPWVIRCDGPSPFEREALGAKAYQLARLQELALPVPAWFVLTARCCQEAARAGKLSPGAQAAALEAFDQLFGVEARVAVRSSAVEEDGATASFAGQLESFLHVRRAGLAEAIE